MAELLEFPTLSRELPSQVVRESEAFLAEINKSVARRLEHLLAVEKNGTKGIELELAICAEDKIYWLNWYGWTYDPRNPLDTPPLPATLPFDLCERQIELLQWFDYLLTQRQDGCVKKSRGVGFTWNAGSYAWHKWRFESGFKTTFGSRKSTEVDQIGNPDTIFEKIRMLYRKFPKWMLPKGFNPNLHDKQNLLINPENHNAIRGEGGEEAQPLDAQVLTPTGWVFMAEIRPGTTVIGSSGRPIKVRAVHPKGVKSVFKLTFSDGGVTRCCGDHLWEVTDNYCRKTLQAFPGSTIRPRSRVKKLSELTRNYVKYKRNGDRAFEYQIPITAPVEFAPVELPVDPYLLGALLGNGGLTCKAGKAISYTGHIQDHGEMFERLATILPIGVILVQDTYDDGTLAARYRIVHENRTAHGGKTNPLKMNLIQLGLIGLDCYSKFIPKCYKLGSIEQRLALVQGLMDTDGTSGRQAFFWSASKQLADGLIEVVRSLGGVAYLRREPPSPDRANWSVIWRVQVVLPLGMIPFRLQRKVEKYSERQNKISRSLVNIEADGRVPVQCITVDAPDGLYVTDDFIVTHNCGRGGRSSLYILDEAGYIEHADRVEAATSANCDVRVWGSTLNPRNDNNYFQRKYNATSPDKVFRFHYSELPINTPARMARKKEDTSADVWASDYEIDDSYTVEDICIAGAWVKSAQRIKGLLDARYNELYAAGRGQEAAPYKMQPRIDGTAGGDVGGGKAQSVVIARFGPIICTPRAWTDPDTTDTALKMLDYCADTKLPMREDRYEPKIRFLRYDSVAIGQGVASTLKRNPRPGLIVNGVNTGNPASDTRWPDGEFAHEKFQNTKAEGWWAARERFKKTHAMVLWLEDPNQPGAAKYPIDELASLPDDPRDPHLQRLVAQLSQVKWFRRENGKIIIESKEALAKRGIPSPDYADALILTETGMSKAEKLAAFAKVNV
jgi:hypothetical protein